MLGAMVFDPHCLVAVIEFADVRYVQFWVEPDGAMIAEVISNLNIGDAVALSAEDEEKLRKAGWSEPSPGPRPNWRFECDGRRELLKVVSMTRDAVYDVLGERDSNPVSVRVWEGQHRPTSFGESDGSRVHERTARDLESTLEDT
jgi:hypothetical protein